jgi:pilus assembly protein Flp/PilA
VIGPQRPNVEIGFVAEVATRLQLTLPKSALRCDDIPKNSLRTEGEVRREKYANRLEGESIKMKALFKRFVREEEGQDLIEYALLAGFISLVAVAAITQVGQGINGVYTNINSQVAAIPGGGS